MIKKLELKNFTIFKHLMMDFCPGINIIIGHNGTGKTHALKAMYSVMSAFRHNRFAGEKFSRIFLPQGLQLGRLVNRFEDSPASVMVETESGKVSLSFNRDSKNEMDIKGRFENTDYIPVYIPAQEILANAPGFMAKRETTDIYFEEVYTDLIEMANLPLEGPSATGYRKKLLDKIKYIVRGKVKRRDEEFFLDSYPDGLEFTLLGTGLRKFGLLRRLLWNRSLGEKSILFWDEPESSMNPDVLRFLVEILIYLQRKGAQLFIVTNSYVVFREFDLQAQKDDKLKYFSLSISENEGEIECGAFEHYLAVSPNPIVEAYNEIYAREMKKYMEEIH